MKPNGVMSCLNNPFYAIRECLCWQRYFINKVTRFGILSIRLIYSLVGWLVFDAPSIYTNFLAEELRIDILGYFLVHFVPVCSRKQIKNPKNQQSNPILRYNWLTYIFISSKNEKQTTKTKISLKLSTPGTTWVLNNNKLKF